MGVAVRKVKISQPPNPEETPGRFLVQPISFFGVNGFYWSEDIQRENIRVIFVNHKKQIIVHCWGMPTLKRERSDFIRLNNGKVCRCKDCVAGRKLVKAGWTPWGKK